MTLYQILTDPNTGVGIPVVYSHYKKGTGEAEQSIPFMAYLGAGQDNFKADDTFYHSRNQYQLEYYFRTKNETREARIEQILLDNGFLYEKSEDVYIEDEDLFVIYYQI